MSGYAIQARIEGVRPRFVAPDRHISDRTAPDSPWPSFAVDLAIEGRRALAQPRFGPALSERLERARERWAEATFYLFDAESWR